MSEPHTCPPRYFNHLRGCLYCLAVENAARIKQLEGALAAAWPGLSGAPYDRPISEVHALVAAALRASTTEEAEA